MKVRKVAIDLARIGTRELTAGANGEPVYGEEVQPLEGADVCIVQRRDAFAVFEPFQPLADPICVKSVAGQVVHIEGVPAKSDLVITIEYPGLRPVAITDRTDDYDVGSPPWGANYWLILLKAGAVDRWVDPAPNAGPDHGLVALWVAMLWSGRGVAGPDSLKATELLTGRQDGVAFNPSLRVVVEPAGGDAFETTAALAGLPSLSLPRGSARIRFINEDEHLICSPSSAVAGLPADSDALELPVLAGHDHTVGVQCSCGSRPGDGELLDLATCTFAPAIAADGDAGGS